MLRLCGTSTGNIDRSTRKRLEEAAFEVYTALTKLLEDLARRLEACIPHHNTPPRRKPRLKENRLPPGVGEAFQKANQAFTRVEAEGTRYQKLRRLANQCRKNIRDINVMIAEHGGGEDAETLHRKLLKPILLLALLESARRTVLKEATTPLTGECCQLKILPKLARKGRGAQITELKIQITAKPPLIPGHCTYTITGLNTGNIRGTTTCRCAIEIQTYRIAPRITPEYQATVETQTLPVLEPDKA